MSARTRLRDDFDASAVRSLAKASKDAAQTRRLMTHGVGRCAPDGGGAEGLSRQTRDDGEGCGNAQHDGECPVASRRGRLSLRRVSSHATIVFPIRILKSARVPIPPRPHRGCRQTQSAFAAIRR